MILAENAEGRLEFVGNELIVSSKIEDPPAVRLGAPAGRSLGKVCFNRIRPDGVPEECVLIQGKEDERRPGSLAGEVRIDLRRPNQNGDSAMQHVATIRHDTIEVRVALGSSAYLRSETGRYRFHMQSDGNAVLYDDGTGQALWASQTVVV